MTETWRPVVGFEGYYEVSDHGRVRTVARVGIRSDGRRRPVESRIRATHPDSNGRLRLRLDGDGARRVRRVHQLVAEAFLGPAPEGLVVCHNDGNHLNNHVSNLRWDSMSSNQYDSVEHGTHAQARKTHCPRGHAYSAENLVGRAPGRWNRRDCRTCHNERMRAVMRERYRAQRDARKKPIEENPA